MHNRRGMALALDGVGAALARLRRLPEAWSALMEGLTLYRELGNQSGQAMMLADLAMVMEAQADHTRAASCTVKGWRWPTRWVIGGASLSAWRV